MRRLVVLALVAIAVAEISEPVFEEEDLADVDYNDEQDHDRQKRAAYVEGPYEEHIRIKRREDEPRNKRDAAHLREIKQYEVHEFHDEGSVPSPPYEEMLAASAEHYHKVYAPDKPRTLQPEVRAGPLTFGVPVEETVKPAYALPPVSTPKFSNSKYHVNLAPASVPNVEGPVGFVPLSAAPLVVSDDLSPAAGHHHEKEHPHSHGYSRGGGRQQHGKHYAERGGKVTIFSYFCLKFYSIDAFCHNCSVIMIFSSIPSLSEKYFNTFIIKQSVIECFIKVTQN